MVLDHVHEPFLLLAVDRHEPLDLEHLATILLGLTIQLEYIMILVEDLILLIHLTPVRLYQILPYFDYMIVKVNMVSY